MAKDNQSNDKEDSGAVVVVGGGGGVGGGGVDRNFDWSKKWWHQERSLILSSLSTRQVSYCQLIPFQGILSVDLIF